MKEEASVTQKIDVTSEDKQSTEDEKDKDTKEDTNIVGDSSCPFAVVNYHQEGSLTEMQ